MSIFDWARHADAIEDAREALDTTLISRAVLWAFTNSQPEVVELCASLTSILATRGNCNAHACETNRALEIVLDAYLESKRQEAA